MTTLETFFAEITFHQRSDGVGQGWVLPTQNFIFRHPCTKYELETLNRCPLGNELAFVT